MYLGARAAAPLVGLKAAKAATTAMGMAAIKARGVQLLEGRWSAYICSAITSASISTPRGAAAAAVGRTSETGGLAGED